MEMLTTATAATTIALSRRTGRAPTTKASCQFALTYSVVMATLTRTKNAMTTIETRVKMAASIARFHWAGSVRGAGALPQHLMCVSRRVEMEKSYISIGTMNLSIQKPVILVSTAVDKDVIPIARSSTDGNALPTPTVHPTDLRAVSPAETIRSRSGRRVTSVMPRSHRYFTTPVTDTLQK